MSDEMTIYFDTSFFIALGKADEQTAMSVLDELNDLGVRFVRSEKIFAELAMGAPSQGAQNTDSLILERLTRFSRPALEISFEHQPDGEMFSDNEWSALGVDFGRDDLAQLFTTINESMSYVTAASAAASNPAHGQAMLQSLFGGHPQVGEAVAAQSPEVVAVMFNNLIERQWPEGPRIQPTGDLTRDTERMLRIIAKLLVDAGLPPLPELSQLTGHASLAETFGFRRMKFLEMNSKLQNFQASQDARSVRALTDPSDSRFKAWQRDFEHMALFSAYSDQINLLHIDGPRKREMNNTPNHPMRQAGLAERCFCARFSEIPSAVNSAMSDLLTSWASKHSD